MMIQLVWQGVSHEARRTSSGLFSFSICLLLCRVIEMRKCECRVYSAVMAYQ